MHENQESTLTHLSQQQYIRWHKSRHTLCCRTNIFFFVPSIFALVRSQPLANVRSAKAMGGGCQLETSAGSVHTFSRQPCGRRRLGKRTPYQKPCWGNKIGTMLPQIAGSEIAAAERLWLNSVIVGCRAKQSPSSRVCVMHHNTPGTDCRPGTMRFNRVARQAFFAIKHLLPDNLQQHWRGKSAQFGKRGTLSLGSSPLR